MRVAGAGAEQASPWPGWLYRTKTSTYKQGTWTGGGQPITFENEIWQGIEQALAAYNKTETENEKDLSPCHGLAGTLLTLEKALQVRLFKLIEREKYARFKQILQGRLVQELRARLVTPTETLPVMAPGLMTGLAGCGYTLLQLATPSQVPALLELDDLRNP